MKQLIPLLFLALPVMGHEYSIGVESSKVNHKWWYDAKYTLNLNTIRFETRWDNNISLSTFLGNATKVDNEIDSKFKEFQASIDYAWGVELIYNYEVTEDLEIFFGVGKYEFSMPKYIDNREIKDNDSNEGVVGGVKYKLYNNLYGVLRYNKYQKKYKESVDDYETTEGIGIGIEYRF